MEALGTSCNLGVYVYFDVLSFDIKLDDMDLCIACWYCCFVSLVGRSKVVQVPISVVGASADVRRWLGYRVGSWWLFAVGEGGGGAARPRYCDPGWRL